MAHRLSIPSAAAVLLLGALTAHAQAILPDPTRPPQRMPGAAATESSANIGPVLQSIRIPEKGPAQALIGGQVVKVGERYGEYRLVALNEREAILEGPAGKTVLPLTPGIEKKNFAAPAAPKAAARPGSLSEVKP